MYSKSGIVTDQSTAQVPVAKASVFVRANDGSLASLFDAEGNDLDNPLITDVFGAYSYHVESEGQYTHEYWFGARKRYVENTVIGSLIAAVNSSPENAGKFIAYDAKGNPTASTGTGADAGLRTALAADDGAALLGYSSGGAGAAIYSGRDKLREIAVSLEEFGATGDGAADDAPALRKAIAYLKTIGGGVIRLGAGKWYRLTSGDPRGLNLLSTTGVDAYYAIAEAASGVTIEGAGKDGGFRYNPNRLGARISSGIYEAGAIFTNFWVASPSAPATAVSSFTLRNFAVKHDAFTGTASASDGQVLYLSSGGGTVANGTIRVEDVTVSDYAGSQLFGVEKGDLFIGLRNHFYNGCRDANQHADDVSAFFIDGTMCRIEDNYGYNTKVFGTLIEAHCKYNYISGNVSDGFAVHVNAVSKVLNPDSFYDQAEFVVENNTGNRCITFANDYVYAGTGCRKALLAIKNNTIRLAAQQDGASAGDTVECIVRDVNDRGDAAADILATTELVVKGNQVSTTLTADLITEGTASLGLIANNQAVNITIADNDFGTARRGIVSLLSSKLASIRVARNSGMFGVRATDGANDTALGARTGVKVLLAPGVTDCDVSITENRFVSAYAGAQGQRGLQVSNQTGATLSSKVVIKRNTVSISAGMDVEFVVGSGSHFGDGTVYLDHDHSVDFSGATGPQALILCNITDFAAPAEGSIARYRTTTVRAVNDGGNPIFPSESWGSAAPTTGFYHRGSRVWFPAPASPDMGVVLPAGGSPGTWKAFGGVAA